MKFSHPVSGSQTQGKGGKDLCGALREDADDLDQEVGVEDVEQQVLVVVGLDAHAPPQVLRSRAHHRPAVAALAPVPQARPVRPHARGCHSLSHIMQHSNAQTIQDHL